MILLENRHPLFRIMLPPKFNVRLSFFWHTIYQKNCKPRTVGHPVAEP